MHYYNSYAVRDRVSIHGLSDITPNLKDTSVLSIPVKDVLPSAADEQTIKHHFTILVSRMLAEHLKHFTESYSDVIDRHINHDYYKEMSQKSVIKIIIII